MKLVLGFALLASTVSAFAQDIHFNAQERWLAQGGGITCGATNTPAAQAPTEFRNRAIIFTYMTTDYSLDNGKFVASFYEKSTECRYNMIGLSDNVEMIFTKTDSVAYPVNGARTADCSEGKAYLDSLFANPVKYLYGHGTLSLQVASADADKACGEGATHVGIFFKKAAKTKID
jgi:hypothetical protein